VVSVPGFDVLDSSADHEAPALALEGGDPVHDLNSLPLAHYDALAPNGGFRARVGLEGSSPQRVRTNLPNEVGFDAPFDVIATRCFAASGPAAATDDSVTVAASATSTARAFIFVPPLGSSAVGPDDRLGPYHAGFSSVSNEQQPRPGAGGDKLD
jgi:hypothetical protein